MRKGLIAGAALVVLCLAVIAYQAEKLRRDASRRHGYTAMNSELPRRLREPAPAPPAPAHGPNARAAPEDAGIPLGDATPKRAAPPEIPPQTMRMKNVRRPGAIRFSSMTAAAAIVSSAKPRIAAPPSGPGTAAQEPRDIPMSAPTGQAAKSTGGASPHNSPVDGPRRMRSSSGDSAAPRSERKERPPFHVLPRGLSILGSDSVKEMIDADPENDALKHVLEKARAETKLTPGESDLFRRSYAKSLEGTEKAMTRAEKSAGELARQAAGKDRAQKPYVMPPKDDKAQKPYVMPPKDEEQKKKDTSMGDTEWLKESRTVWPFRGRVTQEFGPTDFHLSPPRTYQGRRYEHFHSGLDLAAARGTPIAAIAAGKVTNVLRSPNGLGMHVIIAHPNGMVSTYGHMEEGAKAPVVKPGQIVRAGQKIGHVGMTGLTTGPHLHLMTKKGGELTNPRRTLP